MVQFYSPQDNPFIVKQNICKHDKKEYKKVQKN